MNRIGLMVLGLAIVALQVILPRVNAEENPIMAQTPPTQTDPRLQEADRLNEQVIELHQ